MSCQKKERTEELRIAVAFNKKRDAFFNNLKSPTETAAQLQAAAAVFNAGLLHDPRLVANYTTDQVKAAANLGIYLADLNYCIAYGKSALTRELFTAAHDLSKVIGLEQPMLAYLLDRYSVNLNENDSAKDIIDELFEQSTSRLRGTDREKLVGIAMAAYQVENLHLALGTLASFPKDILPEDALVQMLIPIVQVVLNQQKNMETTYGFLRAVADPMNPNKNPNYAYYSSAYQNLIGIYKRLNADELIASNQGTRLMNDAVVLELQDGVEIIRAKIISID